MKIFQQQCRHGQTVIVALFTLFLLCGSAFCQSGPPSLPPDPLLNDYFFSDTNWLSENGYEPIAFTNLVSVPVRSRNALLLDTTNLLPAFLNYNVVETNDYTNLDFSSGAIKCAFLCDWASADTNQDGTGPGDWAYLLAAGDFSSGSPDGLWRIYFDPGGTNIYFGSVSNSVSTVFVSAPISWPSNSIHLIGVTYLTNTLLYIDGQLAATGDPVTVAPATNVWTNGFFVGSDSSGYEQARGIFWYLEFWNSNWFNSYDGSYFSNIWPGLSNGFAAWVGGGGGGADFSRGPGSLVSDGGSSGCGTGTNVYMTDMSYAVESGLGNTFTFTIAGGTTNAFYDVFSTTNLIGPTITNSVWTWLGQGTNCGIYSITNQPNTQSFYVLGTPLTNDDTGLTEAYEALIPSWDYADPNNPGNGLLTVTIVSPAQGAIIQ